MTRSTALIALCACTSLLAGCSTNTTGSVLNPFARHAHRYVHIGDPFARDVLETETWYSLFPQQLDRDYPIELMTPMIALPGATSADVLAKQIPALKEANPELVTIFVGLADAAENVDVETFRDNLDAIIEGVLAVQKDPERIVIFTLPDLTVTQKGVKYDRETGGKLLSNIALYNTTIRDSAEFFFRDYKDTAVFPLFEVSQRLGFMKDPAVEDGIHWSPTSHAYIAERLAKHILRIVKK